MRSLRAQVLRSAVVGSTLVALALLTYDRELAAARERWCLEVDPHTHAVCEQLTDQFRSIYQGLRTIARLPGVRTIHRYGQSLLGDSQRAIQEIYNNLASHVQISEVYILPADFDPDAIDPNTGKPQQPIVTFDEVILGRHAENPHGGPSELEVPEIEIHEYRLMKRQLAHFREMCPVEGAVDGLRYPMLSGPEVVTCDNRHYSPSHPDDRDRSGLVLSVPVFGADGRLRGCVSGVILTQAIRDCMPEGNYALGHTGHGYVAGSCLPGLWQQHLDDVRAGRPSCNLVYSRVLPIEIPDSEPGWFLWAGRPDAEFAASNEAAQARLTRNLWLAASILLLVAMLWRERWLARRHHHEELRRRELERARDAAESLSRARTNLLAVASHEIRTPLSGVVGMTDLLLDGALRPEQRALAENANQSGRMLLDLLGGILDFAKVESGQLALERCEFDLHEMLEGVVQLLAPAAAAKSLEFVLLRGEDLPQRAIGDPVRLRQLLTNLVGNAIKFTAVGTVSVSADAFFAGEGMLLILRVADTGVGLDPRARGRVFEPFAQADASTTRRFGGTGLGLSISRGIAQAMGGDIDYTETPGGGTTFAATLPMPMLSPHDVPRPLAGQRVLVLTARERLGSMLLGDLQALGAKGEVAPSADGVVWSDPALPLPDAVLMDEALPAAVRERVFGHLREHGAKTRCVEIRSWTPEGIAEDPAAHSRLVVPATRRQLARVLTPAPASAPAIAAPATKDAGESKPSPRGHALVVDDNDLNLLVATSILRKLGFTTQQARGGREAVELVTNGRFDFVLMDWQMPEMDGLEATRRIREHERSTGAAAVPILALSANTFPSDRAACLEAGMDAFLTKPLTAKVLAAALADVCTALMRTS